MVLCIGAAVAVKGFNEYTEMFKTRPLFEMDKYLN